MQNLLLLLPALGERQTPRGELRPSERPTQSPPRQPGEGRTDPPELPPPHPRFRLRDLRLFAPRGPQPAYAPAPSPKGTREAPRRGGREPEPRSALTLRLAASLHPDSCAETPANSEPERRRTEAAGDGRGRGAARGGAARWGAAHPPRSAGSVPSPHLRLQPRASAASQATLRPRPGVQHR